MDRRPDTVTVPDAIQLCGYVAGQSKQNYNSTTHKLENSVYCYQIRAPKTAVTVQISFKYEARTANQVKNGEIYNTAQEISVTITALPNNQPTTMTFYKDTSASAPTSHITVDTGETFELIVHSNRYDSPTIYHSSFTINHTKSVGQYHYFTMMSNLASDSYKVPVTYLVDNSEHRQALTQDITISVKTPKVRPQIEFALAGSSLTKITAATVPYGDTVNLLVFTNISEAPDHSEPDEIGITAGTKKGNVYPYTISSSTPGFFVITFKYTEKGNRKSAANNFILRVNSGGQGVSDAFDGYISSEGSAVVVLQRDTDTIWHTTTIMNSSGTTLSGTFPTVSVTQGIKTALQTFVQNLSVKGGNN